MNCFQLWPLLVCSLATGCATFKLPSEPQSSVIERRTWGFAGGQSETEVEQLAAIVEHVLPVYRGMVGFRDIPLSAHITDHVGSRHHDGLTVVKPMFGTWIAIRRGTRNMPSVVAHEMAHYYFQDFQGKFPAVLEEGICDLFAGQIYGSPGDRMNLMAPAMIRYLDHVRLDINGPGSKAKISRLLQRSPPIEEVLGYEWPDLLDAEVRRSTSIYGLGWMLAEVIGIGGLSELVQRSDREGLKHVPVEWVLEAAGLEPLNQANLKQAFMKAMGQESPHGEDRAPLLKVSDS